MDLDLGEYCTQVEHYLVRKNGGHIIRIAGPSFDKVCGWAARGVPLKVVYRGIDRCLDRHQKKGPRRRPVPIDFCEADVLDVFDEWRRAVGVSLVGAGLQTGPGPDLPSRHDSLPAHLERVVARLTTLRAGADQQFGEIIDAMVRELDAARGAAKTLRGEPRQQLLTRLRALDATLIETARSRCDAAALDGLRRDADAELAPFRDRMPAGAYEQARSAALDRLVRDRARLPTVSFE